MSPTPEQPIGYAIVAADGRQVTDATLTQDEAEGLLDFYNSGASGLRDPDDIALLLPCSIYAVVPADRIEQLESERDDWKMAYENDIAIPAAASVPPPAEERMTPVGFVWWGDDGEGNPSLWELTQLQIMPAGHAMAVLELVPSSQEPTE